MVREMKIPKIWSSYYWEVSSRNGLRKPCGGIKSVLLPIKYSLLQKMERKLEFRTFKRWTQHRAKLRLQNTATSKRRHKERKFSLIFPNAKDNSLDSIVLLKRMAQLLQIMIPFFVIFHNHGPSCDNDHFSEIIWMGLANNQCVDVTPQIG